MIRTAICDSIRKMRSALRPPAARVGFAFLLLYCVAFAPVFAQAGSAGSRFALVIGNGNYSDLSDLKNPANDATDMAASLKRLGFATELLVDADLVTMEDAVSRLGTKLSGTQGAVGFFYYAGHGVQSGGTNYLIPADARISSESYLRTKALPLPAVLDTIQQARGTLAVVVLDACRDNPFSWARSGSARGLSVVGTQPTGSIVVYATGAGSVARDGTGRNGVFTQELLRQLGQPGLEIGETFKLTGKAVAAATNGAQVPAIYSQFFESYYLLPAPVAGDSGDGKDSGAQQGSGSVASAQPKPSSGTKMTVSLPYGSIVATTRSKGTLYLDGVAMGELPAGAEARLDEILVGEHELWMRYGSGQDETRRVSVEKDGVLRVAFSGSVLASLAIASVPAGMIPMVFVEGGSFMMGSDTGESDEKPEHRVTLSPFYIGKYEVTQAQYRTVTGTNPSYFADGGDADRRPVEQVSWHDAVAFCNRLSDREGLSKVYAMSGIAVTADFSRNGYRLPTEAEWEYAARGGKVSRGFTYSGSKDLGQVAWFRSNSGSATHTIGAKTANELGLHDMSGNVWEWCNDWYDSGYYGKSPQDNPAGASSEEGRVYRGGGWSYYDEFCRSVNRSGRKPGSLDNFVGFRVARRP